MALVKLKDIATHQQDKDTTSFSIDDFSVYTTPDEKVGSVKDVLVDEQEGLFRYLVVDTGPWVLGKTVLLPIGLARFDFEAKRIYVDGWTKKQVEDLPEFTNDLKIDQDYEERVRGVYRPLVSDRTPVSPITSDRSTYSYSHDPHLYNRSSGEEDLLRRYERQISRTPQ